ncbi:hypothetical protein [Atopomonas sediminilitoris]|uniref:hypothetical protein n=1 Tax=Atopomonas sediminilitoris TaxID=2919919 RepID=UPI001F4DB3F9|nr:hypothetical protein [Atopomonas sediminilitoris]MCJ8170261.1 hypothetical protein [Atopomonas sediminilitoris]
MVQVDVFWSYGLGAGFALAAARQLAAAPAGEKLLDNPFFSRTLLYLALLFGPSGMILLWQFPDWETMQVARQLTDLPTWLGVGFAVTNITQGILGFYLCRALIRQGRSYQAFWHLLLAYFGMLFILVHGWDGLGYQRFLSADHQVFAQWHWGLALEWFFSPVALTLYAMGAILLPVLFIWMVTWLAKGRAQAGATLPNRAGEPNNLLTVVTLLALVFGLVLGSAIVVSVAVHWLGWALGALFGVAWLALLGLPQAGPARWFYRRLLWLPAPRAVVSERLATA